MNNKEIADTFNQLADLLEIEGENPFRVRAYRNAALAISSLPYNINDAVKNHADLTEIPSIGKDLAAKIQTLVTTGKLPLLKEVAKRVPRVLVELLKVESLGPKRVLALYQKLKIRSLADLNKAIDQGKVHSLPRFGEKIEQKIKESIKHVATYSQRFKLADAVVIAQPLIEYLKTCKAVKEVVIAGSYRRHKDTVGDLDVLITTKNANAVIKHFIAYLETVEVLSEGSARAAIRLKSGMQVDLRVVPQESYGATLLYFTGSKAHSVELRKIALKKQLKLNEYGVFKKKRCLASKTEQDMYRQLDLAYIEPELREGQGEIEAALKGNLPKLVNLQDIRGDLHCHTTATDGRHSLEQMAKAAEQRGYEYIAITDHSKHLTVAHGLDEKALLKQIKAIEQLNHKLNKIVILKAIEVDILEDGSLDLSNSILKELDVTVCSIHSHFNLPIKKQTQRIIRAMDNHYFNILGHPTGRLINRREPYQVDLERVMQAAKIRHCFLEIDGQPQRLDLNDIHCRMAKEIGLKLVVSSDAHSVDQFSGMQFGVYQARRGWLEAKDILNTYNLAQLKKLLRRN